MKTDKPFRKSFACGGVLFVLAVGLFLITDKPLSAYQIGHLLGSVCVFPALATGIWGWFSKKTWTWLRFALTLIGFIVIFVMLQAAGQVQHP
jgi:hypothetical protein